MKLRTKFFEKANAIMFDLKESIRDMEFPKASTFDKITENAERLGIFIVSFGTSEQMQKQPAMARATTRKNTPPTSRL